MGREIVLAPVPKLVDPACKTAERAAATLVEAAIRPGAGRGRGGHWPARLEALAGRKDVFPDLVAWQNSVKAMRQALLRRHFVLDELARRALEIALAGEYRSRGMYP